MPTGTLHDVPHKLRLRTGIMPTLTLVNGRPVSTLIGPQITYTTVAGNRYTIHRLVHFECLGYTLL